MAGGWHTSSPNGVASKADPTVASALQTIASALESSFVEGPLEGDCIITIDCAGVESDDEFDGKCVLSIDYPTGPIFNQFNGKGVLTIDCS